MQKITNIIISLFFIFLVTTCARVTSLNLKKHSFGIQPNRVVWLQIAGFDEQLISLMKFENAASTSSFENMTCQGSLWSYNLFKLRPNAYDAFLSELTGSKNIKGSCQDYQHTPIWKKFDESGYSSVILERPIQQENSLIQASKCDDNNFLEKSTIFSMQKSKENSELFHYSEPLGKMTPGFYYDRSCKKEGCHVSLLENTIATYEKFLKSKNDNHFMLVRDFALENELERKNIKAIQTLLIEYEKIIKYFQEIQFQDRNFLLIISSAAPINIDFPAQGPAWESLAKGLNRLEFRARKLNAPIFVQGARSENFCGTFEQSEVFVRLLSRPKDLGLEYKFYNPFK